MSTNCDKCGYRDNEVKSGAAISEQGKRITLKVEDKEDLSRDILKVGAILRSPLTSRLTASPCPERVLWPEHTRNRARIAGRYPGRPFYHAGGYPRSSVRGALREGVRVRRCY